MKLRIGSCFSPDAQRGETLNVGLVARVIEQKDLNLKRDNALREMRDRLPAPPVLSTPQRTHEMGLCDHRRCAFCRSEEAFAMD